MATVSAGSAELEKGNVSQFVNETINQPERNPRAQHIALNMDFTSLLGVFLRCHCGANHLVHAGSRWLC